MTNKIKNIDIDSFLESEFSSNDKNLENQTTRHSNLKNQNDKKGYEKKKLESFTKQIEKSLVQKESEIIDEKSLGNIKRIYDEVSHFDRDLMKSFEKIETESLNVLRNISQKYSKSFIETHNFFETNVKKNINKIELEFNEYLKKNNFMKADFKIYEIKREVNKLSDKHYILKEKIIQRCLYLERKIFEKYTDYKNKELLDKENLINEKISLIKNHYEKNEIEPLKKSIFELENEITRLSFVDKVQISNITKVYSFIFFSKKKIIECEKLDMNRYKDDMNKLIDKFYEKIIQKDLNSSVSIYKQIVDLYEFIDERFFDEKIKFQTKINEIYSKINELTLSLNVSNFLENYAIGNLIKKIKDYFKHLRTTRNIDIVNIENLIEEAEKTNKLNSNKELKNLHSSLLKLKDKYESDLKKKKLEALRGNEIKKNDKKIKEKKFQNSKVVEDLRKEGVENIKKKEVKIDISKDTKIEILKNINELYKEITLEEFGDEKIKKAKNLKEVVSKCPIKKDKKDKFLKMIDEIIKK